MVVAWGVLRVGMILISAADRRPEDVASALGAATPYLAIFGVPALIALLKDAKLRSLVPESNPSPPVAQKLPVDDDARRQLTSRWFTRKDAAAEPKGPFDMSSIMDALRAGDFSPRTEVRAEASEDWCVLQEHPVFRSIGKALTQAGYEVSAKR